MKKLLLNLFYDGYSIEEAIEFIQRCYDEKPTNEQIMEVRKIVSLHTNKNWN